jgi:hypothetical protein
MWGKRHCRYKTPDGTSPSIRTPSGVFSCYPLVWPILVPKIRCFGKHSPTESRLQRNGEKGLLRATKGGVLGAMPFVVDALLWTAIAVSAVFVMYLLVGRWL